MRVSPTPWETLYSHLSRTACRGEGAIGPGGGPKPPPTPGPGPRTKILPPSKFDRKLCVGFAGGAVTVGAAAAPGGRADVWPVRYDPRVIEVTVKCGENAGKTLPHKNVVREMILLGHWRGAAAKFPLPAMEDPDLAEAAIVQTAGAGPVLAAAR